MDTVSKPNKERHFLSFSRKLFLSVISLFLAFAACFIAYQYQREKEYKIELLDMQLQNYNDRLQQELQDIPDSAWNTSLNKYIGKYVNKDLRVTIVDLQGNVRFDSHQPDSRELDNHLQRPEVQTALKRVKAMTCAVLRKPPVPPISIRPPFTMTTSSVPPCPMT